MPLTLTRKISLGYFLMICLVLLEGAYAVFELNRLNHLSRSMVEGEVVSMELEKKLIDLFLSQVSSEKKYLVVRDKDFLSLAQTKSDEFMVTLVGLMAGSKDSAFLQELEEIQRLHKLHVQGFLSAVEQEIDDTVTDKDPSGWGLHAESEIRELTGRIEDLIREEELGMARKMSQAHAFSFRAYKITIGIVVTMSLLGLFMAWFMVRSIRGPVRKLKQGTRHVSKGIFDRRIQITTQDEFGDLARAFNSMTEKLGVLEEMKSDFISNVSHELKTPLTSIKAATTLMLDEVPGEVTEKQKRLLGIIQEEVVKLIRLINNLLDLSRIRAGMMQYHFEKGNMASVLNLGMTNMRFLAELKRISMRLEIEENIPPLLLDTDKMEQVVNNLLSNALKFTPEGGGIRIRAYRVHHDQVQGDRSPNRDGMVQVCVEDTGVGIDPEALPEIFERFRQADPLFGKPVKGTGLGLSICKYYIEEHGGKIWAESELGAGSRFYFELPVIHEEKVVEV